MEEDINILDEVVGRSTELREKDFGMLIGTKQMQSIENLIKGYRELEEQLKIDKSYGLEKAELQKEAGCKMLKCKIVDKNIRLNLEIINLKKNYIPKSKVKEKIEELREQGKYCDTETLRKISYQAEILEEIVGFNDMREVFKNVDRLELIPKYKIGG